MSTEKFSALKKALTNVTHASFVSLDTINLRILSNKGGSQFVVNQECSNGNCSNAICDQYGNKTNSLCYNTVCNKTGMANTNCTDTQCFPYD